MFKKKINKNLKKIIKSFFFHLKTKQNSINLKKKSNIKKSK